MSSRTAKKRRTARPMEIGEAEETYGFHRWGANYLSVGDDGNLRVHPTKEPDVWIDLMDVVARMRRRHPRSRSRRTPRAPVLAGGVASV